MAPVLAEHGALHGQGAIWLFQFQTQRLPQKKILLLQRIRLLHAAQVHIHQLYQLFLAQCTYGITGICIIRKSVHEGGITLIVHVKENIPAGVFAAGGQKEVFQYVVCVGAVKLGRPVNQVKPQFRVIVLYI